METPVTTTHGERVRSEIPARLKALLEQSGAAYETIEHRVDYTAEEVAADTHTALYDFAKVVIVRAGGEYAMAVLPAHHRVDLGALREALGDQPVELASEDEIARIIPDCDVGAVAPFGRLYALPVVLSLALSHRDRVTFNAGTHTAAIRMKYPDFERIAGGRVLDFSISPLEEDS